MDHLQVANARPIQGPVDGLPQAHDDLPGGDEGSNPFSRPAGAVRVDGGQIVANEDGLAIEVESQIGRSLEDMRTHAGKASLAIKSTRAVKKP